MKTIKTVLMDILEKKAVETVLLSVLGKTVGFKAWLIKFVMKNLVFDMIIEPGVDYAEQKVILFYDKKKGKHIYKSLTEATKDGDIDVWRRWARRV